MPIVRMDEDYLGSAPKDPATGKMLDHWTVMIDSDAQTEMAIPRGALIKWCCPDVGDGMPMPFAIVSLHPKRGIRLRCWCRQKTCTLEWKNGKFSGRHPQIAREA